MADEILERKSFSAGKIILKDSDLDNDCAYIIQSGEVSCFITENGKMIQVGRYRPGEIIAETSLVKNGQNKLNFQALSDTNVIIINRHDFEKKISRTDQTVKKVFAALVKKIEGLESENSEQARQESRNDEQAIEIVGHLLRDMKDKKRKNKYEEILIPHFNVMCKALDILKKEERHAKQRQALEEKVSELKDNKNEGE